MASETIDIPIVFDTQALVKLPWQGHSKENPLGISHSSYTASDQMIFMMANPRYLQDPKTQATANLAVKGYTNDVVRWRAESLSGQAGFSVIINRIVHYSGTAVVGRIESNVADVNVPVPNDDPATFTGYVEKDPYWQCNLLHGGTEGYAVYFYILEYNRGTFENRGWYWWDPSITASV